MRGEETTRTKNHLKGNSSRKFKCPFILRYVPCVSGWKVVVRCGIHNNELAEDLEGRDILGHMKPKERLYMNGMTKYHMSPRYIVASLKDRDPNNPTSFV